MLSVQLIDFQFCGFERLTKNAYLGAYSIDDQPSIFRLIIASIVDRESFMMQCRQLDSTTREYLVSRLDYYQVNISTRQYLAHSSLTVVDLKLRNNSFNSVKLSFLGLNLFSFLSALGDRTKFLCRQSILSFKIALSALISKCEPLRLTSLLVPFGTSILL